MKDLWRRWKKGMRELTPLQILEAKLFGIIGQMIGLCLAMVFLWLGGFNYFIVFMAFTIFLLYLEFVSSWKQYDQMRAYR